jgi:hypothetical protein
MDFVLAIRQCYWQMQTIPLQVLNVLLTHYTVITADVIAVCKNMIIVMDDFYFFCIENNEILFSFGDFFVHSYILLCLST